MPGLFESLSRHMRMKNNRSVLAALVVACSLLLCGSAHASRIKDLADIEGVRENQ